ncbi:MAG TPA: PPOX class F420-dependent oxidoreductase [Aeromicrobium sp.]|nr:PPOX class F420-dependent oxidoreductase [Aeromicrobium sp.]
MTTALGELASAHYVLLTTYRKDGTPVGTPVWAVSRDGKLYVWTEVDSWKVKRIRNNPAVTVQPCGIRGAPRGDIRQATARLLDAAETNRVRGMILKKYWLAGPPTVLASRVFRGKDSTIGIELTVQ